MLVNKDDVGSIAGNTSCFFSFLSKNGPLSESKLNVSDKFSMAVFPGVDNEENVTFVVSSMFFSSPLASSSGV